MKKKILLVINPQSGKKQHYLFHNAIKLYYPFCKFVVFKSKYREDIFDFVERDKSLFDDIDIVMIIGGDGMVYLTLNALYKNNIEKPFMVFPAGTGNGIYKSILYNHHEEYTLKEYIETLRKIQPKSMDIIDITTGSGTLKSLLGISWGIISDIDINTEWMRMIGSLRLQLGAVYYLLRKHSYPGELKYKNDNGDTIVHRGNFLHFWANNTSHGSEITHSSPGAEFDDGFIHISFMMLPISRFELLKFLLMLDSGDFVNLQYVNYIKTTEFTLKTDGGKIVVDGEEISDTTINCSISEKNLSIYR